MKPKKTMNIINLYEKHKGTIIKRIDGRSGQEGIICGYNKRYGYLIAALTKSEDDRGWIPESEDIIITHHNNELGYLFVLEELTNKTNHEH
jgi:hypothetical protein